MEIETRENLALNIRGFSGVASNKDYVSTAFKLSDKMWHLVKEKGIKNKGKNIWVYEPKEMVFAGVELDEPKEEGTGLEQKTIHLPKYAYYKHIGPYNLIKQSGQKMIEELKQKGIEIGDIYIEIYGHWTGDETKSETELIMSLK